MFILKRKASPDTMYSSASELDITSRLTIEPGTKETVTYQMGNVGVFGLFASSNAANPYVEKELRLSDIHWANKLKLVLRFELAAAPLQVDQGTRSTFVAAMAIERNPAVFALKGDAYVLE